MNGARLGWYANEVDPIEGEISEEKFRNKAFKTKQNKWWDPNLRLALGWDWRSIVTKGKEHGIDADANKVVKEELLIFS